MENEPTEIPEEASSEVDTSTADIELEQDSTFEGEVTIKELCEALVNDVPVKDLHELEGMAIDDGLGYAFTLLLENGIDDPEAYLKEKGILQ